MEILASRRATRTFTNDPIPREDLEKICKVALLTPTAMNAQDIDIKVVTDKAKLQKASDDFLAAAPSQIADTFNARKTQIGITNPITCDSPAFILLHTNERKYNEFFQFHAGEITMAICVAAKDLGYDTLVVGIILRGAHFFEEPFGIAKGTLCIGISIGKANPETKYQPKEVLCKAEID